MEVFNLAPILPCNYTFPITSIDQVLEVVHIVASVGFGAILDLIERLVVWILGLLDRCYQ